MYWKWIWINNKISTYSLVLTQVHSDTLGNERPICLDPYKIPFPIPAICKPLFRDRTKKCTDVPHLNGLCQTGIQWQRHPLETLCINWHLQQCIDITSLIYLGLSNQTLQKNWRRSWEIDDSQKISREKDTWSPFFHSLKSVSINKRLLSYKIIAILFWFIIS